MPSTMSRDAKPIMAARPLSISALLVKGPSESLVRRMKAGTCSRRER